ncbi:hypothetical protein PG984_002821 [Apiospora sp. TS-2023a]
MTKLAQRSQSGNYGILRGASPKGALLYGPPGTGKTHLARVIAKESGMNLINISASDIADRWFGESEKNIRAVFKVARLLVPALIFIDEADAILRKRHTDDQPWIRAILSEFLQGADGFIKDPRPALLLLATNEPHDVDPAVLRRAPGRIYIRPPSFEERESMFKMFLREETIGPDLQLSWLAMRTGRYTGSDIHTVCVNAAMICDMEIGEANTNRTPDGLRILTAGHFQKAFRRSGPTVQVADLRKFRLFAAAYDPAGEASIIAQERLPDHTYSDPQDRFVRDSNQNLVDGPAEEENPICESKVGSPDGLTLYAPIDSSAQQIRVLQIKTSIKPDKNPEWTLKTVSLRDSPKFTALSYVWGDPRIKEEISLNGRSHKVTANLARALRTVGYHWLKYFGNRPLDTLQLWVDALCINQGNITERGEQVKLMEHIFSSAELVIASMDSEGETQREQTEIALTTTNKLYAVLIHNDGNYKFSKEDMEAFKWVEEAPFLNAASVHEEIDSVPSPLSALERFYTEHPYFRRMWILQEILVSRDLILVSGFHSTSERKINAVFNALTSFSRIDIRRPKFVSAQNWTLVRNMRAGTLFTNQLLYNSIRRWFTGTIERREQYLRRYAPAIIPFVVCMLCLKATDPRDFVYAALGLYDVNMTVDYGKSTQEVYRDLCQIQLKSGSHFLLQFSGIGFISQETPTGADQLPSWAPNFETGIYFLLPEGSRDDNAVFRRVKNAVSYYIMNSDNDDPDGLSRKGYYMTGRDALNAMDKEKLFKPFRNLKSQISDQYILSIAGVKLDGVTKIDRFEVSEPGQSTEIPVLFVQFCSECARRSTKHPTGKPWMLVILQSIIFSRQALSDSIMDDLLRDQAFSLYMLLALWGADGLATPKPSVWIPKDAGGFDAIYDHFNTLFFQGAHIIPRMDSEKRKFQDLWVKGHGNPQPGYIQVVEDEVTHDLIERIQVFCRLSWFETESGYIGRGPPYAAAGDIVCHVKGCFLLVLLRRTSEDHYSHVGPCWVDGMQDGQTANFMQKGASIEWFDIQ